MNIALLGAESTGKTALAQALVAHLQAQGQQAVLVPEYLRSWCEQAGRTPLPQEQAGIAQEQTRQVQALAAFSANDGMVVADTTPLMVALYSDFLFNDRRLYPMALEHQRSYQHTLLMGLDIPWVADGWQRDGPQVRAPVDALLRQTLDAAGIAYQTIYGQGTQRLEQTLSAIDLIAKEQAVTLAKSQKQAKWQWLCEKCGDSACEHRLFSRY